MTPKPSSCAVITNLTQNTLSFLEELRNAFATSIPQSPLETKSFLLTCHDWLSYLTVSDPLWPLYDNTLHAVLQDKEKALSLLSLDWGQKIFSQPLTNASLLYRFYLMRQVLASDIDPSDQRPYIYVAMATMLTKPGVLGPLSDNERWNWINTATFPINVMRDQQSFLQHRLISIVNYQDETEFQIERNHAILTSYSLMYVLSYIKVILDYNQRVYPDSIFKSLMSIHTSTFNSVKGVLCDVEASWLIAGLH